MSTLACKRVFYRPEQNAKGRSMELKFEGLQMQKYNIPKGGAQRVDEKRDNLSSYDIYSWSYGH